MLFNILHEKNLDRRFLEVAQKYELFPLISTFFRSKLSQNYAFQNYCIYKSFKHIYASATDLLLIRIENPNWVQMRTLQKRSVRNRLSLL